jgi:hypothetical protein
MALSFDESLWKVLRVELCGPCLQRFASPAGCGPGEGIFQQPKRNKTELKKVVEKYSGAMYRS